MANATKFAKLLLKAFRSDANAIADCPLTVQAVSGQTANLAEYKDSSGNVLSSISAAGIPSFAERTATGLGLLRTAKAKYDFAVDGGAQGEITLASNCTIPDNAIIIGGIINSTTACTSGGSATIAVGTSAGSSATSLKAATAVASYSADALLATVPVFTAASAVKMTAAGQVTVTVATADLTAGVIEITLVYFVAGA
jgi:hypothetical protein